jgi:hypothetical protein
MNSYFIGAGIAFVVAVGGAVTFLILRSRANG